MQTLTPVQEPKTLSQEAVYQIEGILYRYLQTSGTAQHPKYQFEPLPRQRKTALLTLNRQTLCAQCYQVPGMVAPKPCQTYTQLSLF